MQVSYRAAWILLLRLFLSALISERPRSCFLAIFLRQELIMNPYICLGVISPSSCLSLHLFFSLFSVSPTDDQRVENKKDRKKEIRCLMVKLGNLPMHQLAIYLTDCRQPPCYIHYCPHLIPCSGTAKICPCQISDCQQGWLHGLRV